MGFAKKIFGGAVKPKPQPVAIAPAASATVKSSAQAVAAEEEERRKRLLALNASGANGQMTQAGGDTSMAPVARKTLLGQ